MNAGRGEQGKKGKSVHVCVCVLRFCFLLLLTWASVLALGASTVWFWSLSPATRLLINSLNSPDSSDSNCSSSDSLYPVNKEKEGGKERYELISYFFLSFLLLHHIMIFSFVL